MINNSSIVFEQTIKYNGTSVPKVKISRSEDVYDYMIKVFENKPIEVKEFFYILLLDRSNQTINFSKISEGGVSGTIVDMRIIFKHVVDSLSSGIVLIHNHPSGNVQPSKPDVILTNKVVQIAKLFDVSLIDHIIIGDRNGSFYSMKDNDDFV